jgi:hypothetical protein
MKKLIILREELTPDEFKKVMAVVCQEMKGRKKPLDSKGIELFAYPGKQELQINYKDAEGEIDLPVSKPSPKSSETTYKQSLYYKICHYLGENDPLEDLENMEEDDPRRKTYKLKLPSEVTEIHPKFQIEAENGRRPLTKLILQRVVYS